MQRWIISGVVAMALLLAGAAFGWRAYQQSRPHPVWVPLQLRRDVLPEQQDELVKRMKDQLLQPEVLVGTSSDLDLKKEWQLADDRAAADELKRRLFVRAGEFETSMGRVPTVDVGINGTERESGLSLRISERLMKDVARIIGAP